MQKYLHFVQYLSCARSAETSLTDIQTLGNWAAQSMTAVRWAAHLGELSSPITDCSVLDCTLRGIEQPNP